MNRNKGFTLIEILIVIAVIAILAVLIAGVVKPRKAGAAEVSPLHAALTETDTSFVYTDGKLYILDRGTATWETAMAACNELKAVEPRLTLVVFNAGKEASDSTELHWNKDRTKLTSLPEREEATCE